MIAVNARNQAALLTGFHFRLENSMNGCWLRYGSRIEIPSSFINRYRRLILASKGRSDVLRVAILSRILETQGYTQLHSIRSIAIGTAIVELFNYFKSCTITFFKLVSKYNTSLWYEVCVIWKHMYVVSVCFDFRFMTARLIRAKLLSGGVIN